MPDTDTTLPVYAELPHIIETMRESGQAVLSAAPGAGKTTLVPPALAEHLPGKVLLVEPRRTAARAAAMRIAESFYHEPAEKSSGWKVRGESRCCGETKILAVTPGILLNTLLNDPGLDGYGTVIFDEFHERGLECDLALAMLLDIRSNLRDDIRLLIMSATINTDEIASFLGNAPVLNAEGRTYPVEIKYQECGTALQDAVSAAVRGIAAALNENSGDVLVFLPGTGEIRRTAERLAERKNEIEILPLHGSLPVEEQHRIIQGADGRRRVILATNVAESSLTVPGIDAVVDTGWEKRMRYDYTSGLPRLHTVRISLESARQRAGRAGRTAPGRAYRMWNKPAEINFPATATPEILSADLCRAALLLAAWGTDERGLRFLTPPPKATMAEARRLLTALGLLDSGGKITDAGNKAVKLPLHPRLGILLETAKKEEILPLGCEMAALLEEREIQDAPCDIALQIETMRRGSSRYAPHRELAKKILAVCGGKPCICDTAKCGELLAAAFPDRIAKRRQNSQRAYITSDGISIILPEKDSLCGSEFLAVAEFSASGQNATYIRMAADISRSRIEKLFSRQFVTEEQTFFDAEKERFQTCKILRFGKIELNSTPVPNSGSMEMSRAVMREALGRGLPVIRGKAAQSLLQRIRFANRLEPEHFPVFDDAGLTAGLPPLAGPICGFADLDKINWHDLLCALLGFSLKNELDRCYPENFVSPAGAAHRIDYSGKTPHAAVKVQELYGLRTHPAVGKAALPLTMELLSPADRVIQITEDIPGFWTGSWKEVRKEMRSRYPKHFWPENPQDEKPSARTVKPK